MGQAKKEGMRKEGLQQFAMEVAAEAGAVKECESHAGVYVDQYDDDAKRAAYAIGTNKFKEGVVDGTRQEFMDAIKAAIESAGDECYACAKNMAD